MKTLRRTGTYNGILQTKRAITIIQVIGGIPWEFCLGNFRWFHGNIFPWIPSRISLSMQQFILFCRILPAISIEGHPTAVFSELLQEFLPRFHLEIISALLPEFIPRIFRSFFLVFWVFFHWSFSRGLCKSAFRDLFQSFSLDPPKRISKVPSGTSLTGFPGWLFNSLFRDFCATFAEALSESFQEFFMEPRGTVRLRFYWPNMLQ